MISHRIDTQFDIEVFKKIRKWITEYIILGFFKFFNFHSYKLHLYVIIWINIQ